MEIANTGSGQLYATGDGFYVDQNKSQLDTLFLRSQGPVDISSDFDGGTSNDYIRFLTDNGTERVRVTQDGDVGIGTTSPDQKLDVDGALAVRGKMVMGSSTFTQEPWASSTIAFNNYGSIGTQGSYRASWVWNLERGTDSSWHSLGVNSYTSAAAIEQGNDGIRFRADSSYGATNLPNTRMIIEPDGNVGIGTESPVAGLHIEGFGDVSNSSTGHYLQMGATSGANIRMDNNEINAANNGSAATLYVQNDGGTVSIGNNSATSVGIGMNNPAGPLQVMSENRAVSVLDSGLTNYAELGFTSQETTDTAFGIISGYHLQFQTGTSRANLVNRMFIKENGRVGIGTTAPYGTLTLSNSGPNLDMNDTDGTAGGSTGTLLQFRAGGTVTGQVGFGTSAGNMISFAIHGNYYCGSNKSTGSTFIRGGGTDRVKVASNGEVSFLTALPSVSGYETLRRRTTDGLIGKAASSARYKENILDAGDHWRNIYNLRPVTYDWRESMFDSDPSGVPDDRSDFGLIAEEVAEYLPELVVFRTVEGYGDDPVPDAVDYEKLSIYYLSALQDLEAKNAELTARIEALEA